MDTLYASIKNDIIFAIERSSFSTYAKIDFRNVNSFGLCLKKHVQIYRRLLSELNFIPFTEEKGITLFVCQDKNSSAFTNLFQLKKNLDEHIMAMEKKYV